MTVRELREALRQLPPFHDETPITIWLPGSRVDLYQVIGVHSRAHSPDEKDVELLIEGNLREGSVLS